MHSSNGVVDERHDLCWWHGEAAVLRQERPRDGGAVLSCAVDETDPACQLFCRQIQKVLLDRVRLLEDLQTDPPLCPWSKVGGNVVLEIDFSCLSCIAQSL